MPDNILGLVDYIRLLISAIKSGKIEAEQVDGMSDEGIEALIDQLAQDAASEIARGKALDQG